MTAREVTECTKRIMNRRNEEAKFNAKIHGAKIKEPAQKVGENLTEDEQVFASGRFELAMKEKERELRKKQRIDR